MTEPNAWRPTFMVIGAKKCGTTSLCLYLDAHPEVFLTFPQEPEPAIFIPDHPERDFEWYRALFAKAGSATARGEGTTRYTAAPHSPGAAPRIRELVPDVKMIYVVRDPIERTRSHFAFKTVQGLEQRPIAEAACEGSLYVDCSRYAYQIAPFLEEFPREQLLVIGSRELRADRATTVRRIFEFIGVDPTAAIDNLERESLRTHEVRAQRPWAKRVLHLAGRTPLHRLPSSLKLGMYHSTRRKIPMPDTAIPPDLGRRLWDLFAADLERFRTVSDVVLELGERP